MHAIRAGEGDVFISAGVETVSRYVKGNADGLPDTQNPVFGEAQARTEKFAAGGQTWVDPRTEGMLPDLYIAMGQTAENVAQRRRDHPCGAGRVRRPQPEPRREGDRRRASGPATSRR